MFVAIIIEYILLFVVAKLVVENHFLRAIFVEACLVNLEPFENLSKEYQICRTKRFSEVVDGTVQYAGLLYSGMMYPRKKSTVDFIL